MMEANISWLISIFIPCKINGWKRFHPLFMTYIHIPSREFSHIPPWEKENHLQNAIFGGYVSSLEGINLFSATKNPTVN